MKPILFNTEMVKAILDGRKTQTRRIIKPAPLGLTYDDGSPARKPPYHAGDILWVRETWKQATTGTAGPGLIDLYLYKADEPQDTTGMMVEDRWHPSIHMPWMAARIFLRVISIRNQRLLDMSRDDAVAEGIPVKYKDIAADLGYYRLWNAMQELWNNNIKPADMPRYGWNANPWVWVIEFERVDRKDVIG